VFNPIDSIVNAESWVSSNPAIAKVDGNGVVTGVSEGTAVIKASAKKYSNGEEVTSGDFVVTVSAAASKFGSKIATHLSTLSLSELQIADVTDFVGCEIFGDVLTLKKDVATITTKNGVVTITRCGKDDIAIENADIFAFDENKKDNYVLAIGNVPLVLQAKWLSADNTAALGDVVWTSSREAIATVKDGVVTG
ncbi:MAG: Ig-like domain-containing protein, partial [Clostridia bacterium]